MKKKKLDKIKDHPDFIVETIDAAGRKCELCQKGEGPFLPLSVHFIDRNPKNREKKNLAVLCPPCKKCFTITNPEGLSIQGGLYAFAVNRGLYKGLILQG